MSPYTLRILPLFQFLLNFISVNELNIKEVAFADDFMVADKSSGIKDYRSQLTSISTKYGYKSIKILPYSKRRLVT